MTILAVLASCAAAGRCLPARTRLSSASIALTRTTGSSVRRLCIGAAAVVRVVEHNSARNKCLWDSLGAFGDAPNSCSAAVCAGRTPKLTVAGELARKEYS